MLTVKDRPRASLSAYSADKDCLSTALCSFATFSRSQQCIRRGSGKILNQQHCLANADCQSLNCNEKNKRCEPPLPRANGQACNLASDCVSSQNALSSIAHHYQASSLDSFFIFFPSEILLLRSEEASERLRRPYKGRWPEMHRER